MGDKPRPGPADLLDRELHPSIAALLAVVEGGHGPGDLYPLCVLGWVVVTAVVSELLHEAESSTDGSAMTHWQPEPPGDVLRVRSVMQCPR